VVVYVALIAIINLCIGAALGYLYAPFALVEPGRDEPSHDDHQAEIEDSGQVALGSEQNAETLTDCGTESASVSDLPGAPEDAAPGHDLRETWSKYTEQLRDVRQRAEYLRTSQDKNLGRQVANQLQNSIENWYAELQRLLDAPEEVSSADLDMTSLEMFSSQVETSLSNIKTIDWSLKFEEVLGQIENEITLLYEQQRTVVPPAGRAHAANV
jgi:hypothetical protein